MTTRTPNYLQDALNIYLAYAERQAKRNPAYKPNPILRAIACALESSGATTSDKRIAGLSSDEVDGKIVDAYTAIMERDGDGWALVAVVDMETGHEMPTDVIISFLNLQIYLDRVPGKLISAEAMVEIANKCFTSPRFIWMATDWKLARDYFREQLAAGKVKLPKTLSERVREQILAITYEMKWEEYGHDARSLIGAVYLQKLIPDKKTRTSYIAITTPEGQDFEKHRVFQSLKQILLTGGGYITRKYPGLREIRGSKLPRKKLKPGRKSN